MSISYCWPAFIHPPHIFNHWPSSRGYYKNHLLLETFPENLSTAIDTFPKLLPLLYELQCPANCGACIGSAWSDLAAWTDEVVRHVVDLNRGNQKQCHATTYPSRDLSAGIHGRTGKTVDCIGPACKKGAGRASEGGRWLLGGHTPALHLKPINTN